MSIESWPWPPPPTKERLHFRPISIWDHHSLFDWNNTPYDERTHTHTSIKWIKNPCISVSSSELILVFHTIYHFTEFLFSSLLSNIIFNNKIYSNLVINLITFVLTTLFQSNIQSKWMMKIHKANEQRRKSKKIKDTYYLCHKRNKGMIIFRFYRKQNMFFYWNNKNKLLICIWNGFHTKNQMS